MVSIGFVNTHTRQPEQSHSVFLLAGSKNCSPQICQQYSGWTSCMFSMQMNESQTISQRTASQSAKFWFLNRERYILHLVKLVSLNNQLVLAVSLICWYILLFHDHNGHEKGITFTLTDIYVIIYPFKSPSSICKALWSGRYTLSQKG